MYHEDLRDIPTIGSEHVPDLEWSLKPIVLWMQIFGVPFRSSSSSHHYISLFVGIMMMIWIGALNIYSVYGWYTSKSEAGWMTKLNKIYPPLSSIVVAFSLIISVQFKWPSIWKMAIEIEKNMGLDLNFYRFLRKIAMAGVAANILGAFNKAMAMYAAKSFNSFSVSLIADGFNAMYQILALILFVCLTWMASKMLDVLADQLTTDRMTLSGAISQRLQKWTHDYGLINDYIKEINDFFGTILFLSFGNQILNIILNLSLLKRQEEINFFVAMKACQGLRKIMKSCEKAAQWQIQLYIIDMSINSPKITAMGMFEIEPQLFLTFAGVIFTSVTALLEF